MSASPCRAGHSSRSSAPPAAARRTLLMMLAGLEPISSGTIEIAGQPVTEPRRDVGIIFQDPTLLPWKTAMENVLFPIEIFGLPLREYRPRAQALLELVGARRGHAHAPAPVVGWHAPARRDLPGAYSRRPAVLLMDEPFSALDAITRDELNVMLLISGSATSRPLSSSPTRSAKRCFCPTGSWCSAAPGAGRGGCGHPVRAAARSQRRRDVGVQQDLRRVAHRHCRERT